MNSSSTTLVVDIYGQCSFCINSGHHCYGKRPQTSPTGDVKALWRMQNWCEVVVSLNCLARNLPAMEYIVEGITDKRFNPKVS